MTFGPSEIRSLVNGTVRLDGGGMFGVVPKVLWEPRCDVDELNRILLATRTLLAVDRTARRVILVDTGCGLKWSIEQAERYAVQFDPGAIPHALAEFDLTEDDVTDVVISHLHFDHNGGLCDWADEERSRTKLRYPNARHWVHRRHWDHARHPSPKDRGSFVPADYADLADHGVLSFVDSDETGWHEGPFEGLRWFVSNGHTPFQLHPVFGTGDDGLIFAGDIVPTSTHLGLGWVMAYDVEPMVTIAEKQAIYDRCLSEGFEIAFPHDRTVGIAALRGTSKRPELLLD